MWCDTFTVFWCVVSWLSKWIAPSVKTHNQQMLIIRLPDIGSVRCSCSESVFYAFLDYPEAEHCLHNICSCWLTLEAAVSYFEWSELLKTPHTLPPARLRWRLALPWVLLADGGYDVKLDGRFRSHQRVQWEHRKSRRWLGAHRANTARPPHAPFTEMKRGRENVQFTHRDQTCGSWQMSRCCCTFQVSCSHVSAGRMVTESQLLEPTGSLWLPAPAGKPCARGQTAFREVFNCTVSFYQLTL